MLEVFPVTETELEILLTGYQQYVNNGNVITSFASFHNCDNNDPPPIQLTDIEDTGILKLSSNSILQAALDQVFLIGTGYDDSEEFKFLEAMSILLGRRGSKNVLSTLYKAAAIASAASSSTLVSQTSSSKDKVACVVQPDVLAGLIHRLILASYSLRNDCEVVIRPVPESWTNSLRERIQNPDHEEGVTLAVWNTWADEVVPQAYQTLSTYVHYAIFGLEQHHPFWPGTHPLKFPKVDEEPGFWRYSYQSVPSSLALLSQTCLGAKQWSRLYSSDFDGYSFATFQRALLSYQGATVILIQTGAESSDLFGFYSSCPWKESRKWYGGHDTESFLFGLKPTLQFYGPIGDGRRSNKMFLNNPLSPKPGNLTGLAIGGINDSTPRIHIPPSFHNEQCKAGSMDGVYTSGPLLSKGEVFFKIDLLEVWAISSSDVEYRNAVEAGQEQAEIKEAGRIQAATVDRKQFLEDFQSGQYMNSVFAHREQARGRHSFCADDEGGGYFIDEKRPSMSQDFESQ